MTDKFSNYEAGLTSPIETHSTVTPSETELLNVSRGIYVGVSGDLEVTDLDNNKVTYVGLAAGVYHPIRAKIIHATATTADNIIAGW